MSDIDNFLRRFGEYLAKANESKKRGNNDYNPLEVMKDFYDKTNKHKKDEEMLSTFLYSLLNPNSEHYQDDLFLRFFLESLQLKGCEYKNLLEWFGETKYAKITKERFSTSKELEAQGRMDLYISNNEKHIILENKVASNDGNNQIAKYISSLYENDIKYENIAVVYLTPKGVELSRQSRNKWQFENEQFLKCGDNKVLYKQISYEKDILNWIEKCKSVIKKRQIDIKISKEKIGNLNLQTLDSALRFFRSIIVQIIINKKESVMNIVDFFKDSEDFENDFKLAFEIINNIDKIKEAYLQKQAIELQKELDKLSLTDWKILVGEDECKIFRASPHTKLFKNIVVYNKRYEESKQTFRYMFENEKDKDFGVRLSIRKDGDCIVFVDKDGKFEKEIAKKIKEAILKSNFANIKFHSSSHGWFEGYFNLYDCKNNPLKYFKENYEKVIKVNEWLKEQEFNNPDSEIAKLAKEVKDYNLG